MPKGIKGFVKGQSGNPAGRPKEVGETRRALQMKIVENGDKIIATALKMAENGNEGMIRFLADRLLPKQIEGFKNFDANADAKTIINDTLQQYTDGEISSEALNDVKGTIQTRVNVVEFEEFKSKVNALWDAKQKREGFVP